VELLAAVWPAGDPSADPCPTVIDSWLRDWDAQLAGALTRACRDQGFAWALSSHLWLETQHRLPFSTLLLLGATPLVEADWPGWTAIGGQLGDLVAERSARSLGLVVDRMFAPGLGELATGLFGALGAGQSPEELVITGSIAWTDADFDIVMGAWNAAAAI
jgi:hypothetical protein